MSVARCTRGNTGVWGTIVDETGNPEQSQLELRATARRTAWVKAATINLAKRAHITLLSAAIGFGIGWLLNVWVMGRQYDGFRVPNGAAATGEGNLIAGSIFYLVASALITAVITYRLTVGKDRFWAEARDLPNAIKRAFDQDGDQTLFHVLVGFSGSMLIAILVGPSIAGILAAGVLLLFAPVLRPVVVGSLMTVWRHTIAKVAPKFARPPGPIAMLVGVSGTSMAFAFAWISPGTSGDWLFGIGAAAGAYYLATKDSDDAPTLGSGTAVLVLFGLVAVAFGLLETILDAVAFADDGGFSECGNPNIIGYVFNCNGSGRVIELAFVGGTASGVGAGVGAAAGTAVGAQPGPTNDPDDPIPGEPLPPAEGPRTSDDADPGTGPTKPRTELDPKVPILTDSDGNPILDENGDPIPVGEGSGTGGSGGRPKKDTDILEKLDVDDIDWENLGIHTKVKLKQLLMQAWRDDHPNADFTQFQAAQQDLESMMSGGYIPGWAKDAWRLTADTANETWKSLKSGQTLQALIGTAEGAGEALVEGVVGIWDLMAEAPEMVGNAAAYWKEKGLAGIKEVMNEIPGMTTQMMEAFLANADELYAAALAGDDRRIGQAIGKMAGTAEFEILMGMGMMKVGTTAKTAMAAHGIENMKDVARITRTMRAVDNFDFDEYRTLQKLMDKAQKHGPDAKLSLDDVTDFGIAKTDGKRIQEIAEKYGVEIQIRPGNPYASKYLEAGTGHPKPLGMDMKSINPDDLALGASKDNLGKVGYFEPKKPSVSRGTPDGDRIWNRYDQRMDEFSSKSADMDRFLSEGAEMVVDGKQVKYTVELKDGVLVNKQTGKPFVSDYDLHHLKPKSGTAMDSQTWTKVMYDLKKVGIQHGDTAHFVDAPSKVATKKRPGFLEEHVPGADRLIEFGGDGPKTAYGVDPNAPLTRNPNQL